MLWDSNTATDLQCVLGTLRTALWLGTSLKLVPIVRTTWQDHESALLHSQSEISMTLVQREVGMNLLVSPGTLEQLVWTATLMNEQDNKCMFVCVCVCVCACVCVHECVFVCVCLLTIYVVDYLYALCKWSAKIPAWSHRCPVQRWLWLRYANNSALPLSSNLSHYLMLLVVALSLNPHCGTIDCLVSPPGGKPWCRLVR